MRSIATPTLTQTLAFLALLSSVGTAAYQAAVSSHLVIPAWVAPLLTLIAALAHSIAPVVPAKVDGTVTLKKPVAPK